MLRSSRSFFVSALLFGAASLTVGPALADDGGTGGTGGSSSDPGCTVNTQNVDGTVCAECIITNSDTTCATELGSDYSFVCTQSTKPGETIQVWCNGPNRLEQPDVNATSCAVPSAPSGASNMAGFGLLALGAVFVASARRRRR